MSEKVKIPRNHPMFINSWVMADWQQKVTLKANNFFKQAVGITAKQKGKPIITGKFPGIDDDVIEVIIEFSKDKGASWIPSKTKQYEVKTADGELVGRNVVSEDGSDGDFNDCVVYFRFDTK